MFQQFIGYAYLDENNSVRYVEDVNEWVEKIKEKPTTSLKRTFVTSPKDGNNYLVSSIFLCVPLDYGKHFETFVFPADENDNVTSWLEVYGIRTYSYKEAMETHNKIVERIGKGVSEGEELFPHDDF